MISLLASPLDSFHGDLHDPFWHASCARPLRRIATARPSKHDLWSLIGSDLLQEGLGQLPTLQDKDDKYVIQVATPGVKQQHLNIELVGRRQLVVSAGMRKTADGDNKETVEAGDTDQDQGKTHETQQVAETKQGDVESALSLRKAVNLPQDADIDAISLSYADGMLTIEVPKRTKSKADEVDEETAALESDLKRKRASVEMIRRELEEERMAMLEAESKLREAHAAKRLRIAQERRELPISQSQ
mmetsp:Transcript_34361/g.81943  ORF Transcript_34361/g.81943 Transcript_34361/m.81943 type:complete len:245 (-) Transcript_34361:50-784(-)